MNEYEHDAQRFLRYARVRMWVRFLLTFGQSLAESTGGGDNPPTAYDVLAVIQKYDPGDFENFCSDFGYDELDARVRGMYRAVRREWEKVLGFFTPGEILDIQEIQ